MLRHCFHALNLFTRGLLYILYSHQVNPYVPARGVDALPAPYNSVSSTVRALIAQDKVTGLCAFLRLLALCPRSELLIAHRTFNHVVLKRFDSDTAQSSRSNVCIHLCV
jgi:hypothetical protein